MFINTHIRITFTLLYWFSKTNFFMLEIETDFLNYIYIGI
jgi:hypothetical protein